MADTAKNLAKKELVGRIVKVANSTDKNKIGITGKIIDEKKNIFAIETKNGIKKVPKKEASFCFNVDGKEVKIEGSVLVARPEDRIKKRVEKW